MNSPIALLVGLGNPGEKYANTRHNAGTDFVCTLANHSGASWTLQSKLFASVCTIVLNGKTVKLAIPTTYMNDSGKAVQALSHFFRIAPENIAIAHDELDLPCGTSRYKIGGGHGGHNGLRNIQQMLGNNPNFSRIRIGVGHPGHSSKVLGYVLAKPSVDESISIARSVTLLSRSLPKAIDGQWEQAMHELHSET